jgi:hypothetical protein
MLDCPLRRKRLVNSTVDSERKLHSLLMILSFGKATVEIAIKG